MHHNIANQVLAGMTVLAGLPATCPVEAATPAATAAESTISIEELMKTGWEVAGYAGNADSRTTFILFRKPGETSLVQCLTGYDVTRNPRIFRNCYTLK